MKGRAKLLAGLLGVGLAVMALEQLLPAINGNIVERLKAPSGTAWWPLAGLLGLLLAARLGANAGRLSSQVLQARLVGRCLAERTMGLLRRILAAPAAFHAATEPEKIVERIETAAGESVPFFATCWLSAPVAAGGMGLALWQMFRGTPGFLARFGLAPRQGNPGLACLAVGTALGVVAVTALFEARRARLYREARNADEDARWAETEALRGVQDLRGAGAFAFAGERIGRAVERGRRTALRFQTLLTLFSGAGGLAFAVAEVAVLAGAARLILPGTGFGYEDYASFATLCALFNGSALSLWGIWQEARKAWLARRRLAEFDALETPYAGGTGAAPDGPPGWRFRDVDFAAPDGTPILRGIGLEVRPGEHVALVGPSGCGKSTLLKLAMRHLEPRAGKVEVAGTGLPEWDYAAFARRVAYVSQKPFLFHGTIRDNILMGRELGLSDDELLALAADVGLLDDLRRKDPDPRRALDFVVGSDGRSVSGGQAAKIALARALAGNPDALLLDEATAALDELSQERVARMLAVKCRDKTILSVSHRLPAVRGMDRIVVMDAGRVVQDGTWDALASAPGLFARLVARETGAGTGTAGAGAVPPAAGAGAVPPAAGASADLARALSLSPVFADLDAAQLARLAAGAEPAAAAAGTLVVRKGEAGDSLYVVASGRVAINGAEYGPGAVFGEIALFGGMRRTADVTALEDSAFTVLRRDDVLAACRAAPDIAIRLLAAIARIAARA